MNSCINLRQSGSLLVRLVIAASLTLQSVVAVANPAVDNTQSLGTRDLLQDILAVQKSILSTQTDLNQTQINFKNQYMNLYTLDPRIYDLNKVRKNTTQIIRVLQNFRQVLEDQLSHWPDEKMQNSEFQNHVRGMVRAVHNLIDVVAEISLGNEKSTKGQRKMPAFQGGIPWTITEDNRPLLTKDFQSGDVLLMRGGSAVSAAIARVTDVSSMFSHAAIVYVDSKTGEKYVVEALTEKGATINSLEHALNHGAPRMLALRHHDTKAAAKGAEILYNIIRASIDNNRTFKYDFTMHGQMPDVTAEEALAYAKGSNDPVLVAKLSQFKVFCSFLITWALHLGSDGKHKVPRFPSQMSVKNRAFLERLGISPNTKTIFAPGDLELDPAFKVIGDFREPRRTAALRVDDFIFDKIFDWMEKDQLKFQESMLFEAVGWTGNRVSYIGFIRKLASSLGLPIAPHIPPKVISSVIMLEMMRGTLMKKLAPQLQEFEAKNGLSMPPRLIFEALETIYQADPQILKYLEPENGFKGSCKRMLGS